LEEDFGSTIYDDYKFVTRNDLVKMGLDHLIGSNLLRAYMHGFFMDMRLWKQVKAVSDPFEYENYLKQRVKKKIEEKTGSRISIQKKVPKVNRAFAETLLSRPSRVRELKQAIEAEDVDKAESTVKNPLLDDRFGIMFKDSSFEIDPSSEEYRRLHPGQVKKVDSRFDLVEGSEEEDIGSGAELDFEEDQESEEEEEEDSGEMFGSDEKDDEMDVHPKRQKVSMFGLKRGLDAPIRSLVDSQESRGSTTDLSELPLEERIRLENTSEEKLAESQPQVMFVRGRGRGRGQGRGRGRGRGSRGSRFRGRGRR
jgi:ribosome biogenesis protein ENP2